MGALMVAPRIFPTANHWFTKIYIFGHFDDECISPYVFSLHPFPGLEPQNSAWSFPE